MPLDQVRKQYWLERIRAWRSTDPMPISEADEAELHDAYGIAFTNGDLSVIWFGDPHFGQRFRVTPEETP